MTISESERDESDLKFIKGSIQSLFIFFKKNNNKSMPYNTNDSVVANDILGFHK